jgi:hypothetical protein
MDGRGIKKTQIGSAEGAVILNNLSEPSQRAEIDSMRPDANERTVPSLSGGIREIRRTITEGPENAEKPHLGPMSRVGGSIPHPLREVKPTIYGQIEGGKSRVCLETRSGLP